MICIIGVLLSTLVVMGILVFAKIMSIFVKIGIIAFIIILVFVLGLWADKKEKEDAS